MKKIIWYGIPVLVDDGFLDGILIFSNFSPGNATANELSITFFSKGIPNPCMLVKDASLTGVIATIYLTFLVCCFKADACHAYQILHKNGIPDENIVVMMYDDIAHNSA